MKTPYAIVIGLALIAAAIFFREPSVPPAQAGILGDVDGFHCKTSTRFKWDVCYVLHGDEIVQVTFDGWCPDWEKTCGKPHPRTRWR